jgi:DNA-binding NtrC family response regulator
MGKPWETVIAISDLENRRALAKILAQFGLDAMCVSTVTQCCELLDKGDVALVFSGQYFCDGDYRAILTASHDSNAGTCQILAAARTASVVGEAMRLGVFDVIGIPYRPTDIEWAVIKARRNREALAHASPHLVTPCRQPELVVRHLS